MVTDYYVNVNGKKVLYSTLDSNLKKSLDQQGITETEAARQNIDTSKSYEQQIKDYYERDHVVKQGSKEVSVPGRYAEQFGIAKPDREATRKAIQEKERAEKKAAKAKKKKEFWVNIHGGDEKGQKQFSEIQDKKLQKNLLKSTHPLFLASKGILAPSDNIHFKTKKQVSTPKGKTTAYAYSASLESNMKSYILTGNVEGVNKYLKEIMDKEGARAAFAERERLIAMGIKGTELEGKRQGAGVGAGKIEKEKRAEKQYKSNLQSTAQKSLYQQTFGNQVIGTLGATFDDRFAPVETTEKIPVINQDGSFVGYDTEGNPYQGAPTPIWIVDGQEFEKREDAEQYIKENTTTQIIPIFTLPSPNQEFNTDAPKLPLAQAIEDSYSFLTDKQVEIQQAAGQNPITQILAPINPIPGILEVGKIGLATVAGIENTKEQVIAPLFGSKPFAPITLKSETSDQVVFPVDFNTMQLKSSDTIIQDTKQYVKDYGAGSLVTGLAVSYGVGGASLVQSGVKLGTKVTTKIISKIPQNIKTKLTPKPVSLFQIKPKPVKIYPEIKSQVPLTAKQIKTAEGIMKRYTSAASVGKQIKQPTTLSPKTIANLKPSQKDVRIVAPKQPTTVKLDPSYKPKGRYEGGFKKIFSDDVKTVDFKKTTVKLGQAETKPPQPIKTTYSDQKFREFMKTSGSGTGFTQKPISLGSGAIKKVKPQIKPNYDRASQEFTDFWRGIERPRRYSNIVGKIKLSDDFVPMKRPTPPKIENIANKPKPVEYDALTQDRGLPVPMKRLGSTKGNKEMLGMKDAKPGIQVTKKIDYKIKPKVDSDSLLPKGTTEGIFSTTKVKLGKGIGTGTKTLSKQKTDDFISKLKGTGAKKGTTRKFDEPKLGKDDKLIGSGSSVTITKLKDPTKTIIKPKTKQTLKLEQKKKPIIKSKSPRPISLAKEVDRPTPKTKGSPTILVVKTPEETKKKKKQKTQTISYSLGAVSAEAMILSKDRPQLQSQKDKQKFAIIQTETFGLVNATKQKEKQRLQTGIISKDKVTAKQKPVLVLQPKQQPKEKTEITTVPKLGTKQTPKLKSRTPQPPKQRPPVITVPKFKQEQPPKLTFRTKEVPPPTPPDLTFRTPPPKPPKINIRKSKQPKKKKKKPNEDFFGSTHESDVLGFRSKTADFVIGSKAVGIVVAKERQRERKRASKIRKTKLKRTSLPKSQNITLM